MSVKTAERFHVKPPNTKLIFFKNCRGPHCADAMGEV